MLCFPVFVQLEEIFSTYVKIYDGCNLIFCPRTSSPGVFAFALDVFLCVISTCCRNGKKLTDEFSLHAFTACSTVCTAFSASPFALGWYIVDPIL